MNVISSAEKSPALKITSLSKSFDAGTRVVKDISFEITPGEIFGLLGPNGAGKSTTINMIAGVTRISQGSISIFGHDNTRDYRLTRCLTGVMHQEIVIDNFFTIDRSLRIHSGYFGVNDDPVWRNMLIDRLGLRPHLGKVMIKLSGGLKRRFMVAKALIHKPQLLILDEPTAGVDVELRHSLWDFVREINEQGTTILLTTHYLEEAEQMCGRVAIMNHGEILALEKTTDLLRRCGHRELVLELAEPLAALPPELAELDARLNAGGRTLLLPVPTGAGTGDLLGRVSALGLQVAEVETRQPSLEAVFIELTGLGNGRNA
jgi:ABC-2 type transport system ATP-binding protein